MVGSHQVIIENIYIKYEFTLKRKITVIKGDSGTGKTTLVNMINQWYGSESSGVKVQCDKMCRVLAGRDWKQQLSIITDSIVFIDEQSRFIKSDDFAREIEHTDNYYVLITREKLSNLAFSVAEVYRIATAGKYAGLKDNYTENRFEQIYGSEPYSTFFVQNVVVEDTNSGYQFWKKYVGEKCLSAAGKSNVIKLMKSNSSSETTLAIVDGAAFGADMDEIVKYIKYNPKYEVYAPESFEYLILKSGLIKEPLLEEYIANTQDYADSIEYVSWEDYYTNLLEDLTHGTPLEYSKKQLNGYYLSERNINRVLENVPDVIVFNKKD